MSSREIHEEDARINRAKYLLRRINAVLFWLGVPTGILCLLLALPISGTILMMMLAGWLDCKVNAASVHPCYLMWIDIGNIMYGYLVSAILGGIFNPIIFISLVKTFWPLLLWTAVLTALVVIKIVMSLKIRKKA